MTDLWRDMDFALPAGHPSSWEQECKQLRAERDGLLRVVTDNHDALVRAETAEARVAELEAAAWAAIDLINADLQFEARNGLRAALKGTKT